jgi:hypothetical protein
MRISGTLLLSAITLAAPLAHAWEWDLNVAMQWRRGYEATSTGLGGFSPSDADNASRRVYDDGFVGTDDFGNARGLTSAWGYENASQTPEGTSVVIMTSARADGDHVVTHDLDGGRGIAVRLNGLIQKNERSAYGVVFGGSYTRLQETTDLTFSRLSAIAVRDAYPYNPNRTDFIAAAPPGFAGNDSGLGPLLRTDFTRTTETVNEARSLHYRSTHELESWSASAGVFGEWSLSEILKVRLEVGLTAVHNSIEARITTETQVMDLAPQSAEWSADGDDTVLGLYGGLQLRASLTERGSLLVGVRLSDEGNTSLSAGNYSTEIDADSIVTYELGWSHSF